MIQWFFVLLLRIQTNKFILCVLPPTPCFLCQNFSHWGGGLWITFRITPLNEYCLCPLIMWLHFSIWNLYANVITIMGQKSYFFLASVPYLLHFSIWNLYANLATITRQRLLFFLTCFSLNFFNIEIILHTMSR